MNRELTATERELHETWRPSKEQLATAAAILAADPGLRCVMVGLALPGKHYSWWQPGQTCEPARGFWPVREGDDEGFRAAREESDRSGGQALAGRAGTSSWAVITLREGEPEFAVWEGIYGSRT